MIQVQVLEVAKNINWKNLDYELEVFHLKLVQTIW